MVKWFIFSLTIFISSCQYTNIATNINTNININKNMSKGEVGIASYYSSKFNGRRTASGKIFHNSKVSAAHKKLTLHSCIIVENLSNNKKLKVQVIDRGPYVKGRILDLSKKAANLLDCYNCKVLVIKTSC